MKSKTIPLILFAALSTFVIADSKTKSIGEFIETVGEYEWSNFERIVLIEQNNEQLQFSISLDDSERKKSIGPKSGILKSNKSWFFWIESRNAIWMFDGESRLWKYSFTAIGKNKYKDSINEIKDSGLIPPELKRALPSKFTRNQ